MEKSKLLRGSTGSAIMSADGVYVLPTREKELALIMEKANMLLKKRDKSFMSSLESSLSSDPSFSRYFRDIYLSRGPNKPINKYATENNINEHALISYCNTILYKSMMSIDTITGHALSFCLSKEEIGRYVGEQDVNSILYNKKEQYLFSCLNESCDVITPCTIPELRSRKMLCLDCFITESTTRRSKDSSTNILEVLSERDKKLIVDEDRTRSYFYYETYKFRCLHEECHGISQRSVYTQNKSTGRCTSCSRKGNSAHRKLQEKVQT